MVALRSRSLALSLTLVSTLSLPALAQERAGIVTTAQGPVTIARPSQPTPSPLKFKDEVFVQDRVATGEHAMARLLLGGKAIVTVREFSSLTITELPGKSIIDLGAGRMALGVARERMKQGESIEIRTLNAVASVRGTVVVAEVSQAGSENISSAFTVLRGVVDVTRIDATRNITGAPVAVGALQRVAVDGIQIRPLPAAQPVAANVVQRINADFQSRLVPSASVRTSSAVAPGQLTEAVAFTRQIVTANEQAASARREAAASREGTKDDGFSAKGKGDAKPESDARDRGDRRPGGTERADRGRGGDSERGGGNVPKLAVAPKVPVLPVSGASSALNTAAHQAPTLMKRLIDETVEVSRAVAGSAAAASSTSSVSTGGAAASSGGKSASAGSNAGGGNSSAAASTAGNAGGTSTSGGSSASNAGGSGGGTTAGDTSSNGKGGGGNDKSGGNGRARVKR